MSNWQAQTLGDILPGAQIAVDGITLDIGARLANANSSVLSFSSKISTLEALNAANGSLAAALLESGFYSLMLGPDSGGVVPRISAAADSPPASGYSAAVVIAVSGADLVAVVAKYTKLIQVLTEPIQAPSQ